MTALPNAKHEAFARAIVEGKAGAAAYGAAGYAAAAAAAETNASRLLRNAQVSARIAELKAAAAQASVLSAQRVLDELAKVGFANMADYLTVAADGQPRLHWGTLTRDQAAVLQEVTVDQIGTPGDDDDAPPPIVRVKFKLASKLDALDKLGRHLGLFNRVEITGKDGGPIETKDLTELELARRLAFILESAARKES